MTNRKAFLEEEIPYDKLEKIGIDRRAFLSMPKNLVDPIINGKVSPIIKTHIKAENGKTIEMPMKIQLTHDDQGNVKLQTYPLRKEIANEFNLTTRELNRVKRGDVIRKEIEEDGIKKMKFIQLDNETLSLIPRSIAHVRIAEKLREMEKINDIELGTNQKQAAQEGKPIELNVGGQPVTVGVDLREPQGYKIVNGDMQEWDRQKKIKYDLANDGFMGYVQTEENRWEYQRVVEGLSRKDDAELSAKKAEKKDFGVKL